MAWLTEQQIDDVIAAASADDIIEAMAMYPDTDRAPLQLSREIFNRSADRLGLSNGTTASQMVHASDFRMFTEKMRGFFSHENPLEGVTDLSPDSVDIGE